MAHKASPASTRTPRVSIPRRVFPVVVTHVKPVGRFVQQDVKGHVS